MANPIVQVAVSQQVAPSPDVLQKTGALISQGGTTLAAGATALLKSVADLTAIKTAAIAMASLTSSGTTATGTLKSTTISAGSYNSTTGLVTLTLVASIGVAIGGLVNVASSTGTGSHASIEGTFATLTSGTTIEYTIATGLTMTITGGNIVATHGVTTSDTFITTISGATPAGYNLTVVATATGLTTFTYTLASTLTSPATGTPAMLPPTTAEISEMATTFFAQGSGQAVYVLELGAGSVADGVTALNTYVTANPGVFYSYLVPRAWDANSAFLTFLSGFEATDSKTYFFITTTSAHYADYADKKCVVAMIEAPGVSAIEFSHAADYRVTLNYAPSSTNKVTPFNFSYLFGVTPYPTAGNAAVLSQFNTDNVNVVGTGAQGGISNKILIGGNNMDGNPWNYWYSVDWVQINAARAVTAALINGSNNPVNPIYYDQAGINALQQVVVSVMSSGIADGLVLNPIKVTTLTAAALAAAIDAGTFDGYTVVNAIPFPSYASENPSDYSDGIYNGLSILYVPLRGFDSILINVVVSQFAS